ncbi:uncharacterized protein LOC110988457 [Acanthaster planci]|uniref:non-specific serine/threonine protein kinase n=1 Tax=Acanthaster planci TaxID=133434 RepID=A0A8B7ZQH3_ACAPL|nr:uncharacterized protein LOC110988457 [Acanthaster planci]
MWSRSGKSDPETVLAPISDFNRSIHLTTLLKDKSLRESYATAQTDGQLPANRARVLILGEPRAGKTSLLNRLLDREFDVREQPTEGIDTRMCQVTNVDKQWKETGGAKSDDIQHCASLVTVLGEVSSAYGTTESKEVGGNNKDTPTKPRTQLDLLKLGLELFCLFLVVFVFEVFQYGYVAFVWCTFVALSLMNNYNFAYRFATYVSLFCVLFDAVLRRERLLEESSGEECADDLQNRTIWPALGNMMFDSVNYVILGAATGFGCRTGVAVAFSASVHPAETEATRGVEGGKWDRLVLTLISGAGALLGVGFYIFCTFSDRWHKYRAALCCGLLALILALSSEGDCRHRRFWFLFLNGIVVSAQSTWGTILGRRVSHKYGLRASYVSKKVAGLIFGLYLSYVCGWTMRIPGRSLSCVALYILSVLSLPLFDLHNTFKIWRAKSTFPVKLIREQMKSVLQGKPVLETKLSLWDFAGDTLYHCTHHIFMPDRALYVIVFNLQAAVSDEEGQLQKLLFWLHSVCAHARHPDAVVIIVGTHKESVSEASRTRITNELHRRIASPFCHRLVVNSLNDKPLFLVENSQPVDEDFKQLRGEIFRRVESAEYAQEKYPIKYLHFYREIQKHRKRAEKDCAANVVTVDQIGDLAMNTCDITKDDDLESMLKFFCEAGEIIHKNNDNVLHDYVVLDPQFLVDVMKKLVHIPRASRRSHRFAVDWINYENSGIITEGLLQHIYGDMCHLVPLLTKLLQAYDLMCPVTPDLNPDSSQKSFLVPAMLPPYRGEPTEFWKPTKKDEVFYFDFGFFDPSTVYYRLLTRCVVKASQDNTKFGSLPMSFADRSRFYFGSSCIFKLQLEKSSHQMLLSVTVLAFEPENPSTNLLKDLLEFIRSITARDYPQLSFIFGPRCPYCGPELDFGTSNEDIFGGKCGNSTLDGAKIHVLKMAGHDLPFPTVSPVPLFCGQHRYELRLPECKPSDASHGRTTRPRRVSFGPGTVITKLPPDIFERVCLLLNNAAMIRNWKTLAGELGKDVESVVALDSEKVSNPTECLLREWAAIGGEVTVGDLLEVLGRPSLERMDIIHEIRTQMTSE